jgi:hypothetical protein
MGKGYKVTILTKKNYKCLTNMKFKIVSLTVKIMNNKKKR